MFTTVGVVYGTSRLLTSTTKDPSQTLMTIQSFRLIKNFKPKDEVFCVMMQ